MGYENIKIDSLKPGYRDIVIAKDWKFNPDHDDELNDDEIQRLMTKTDAKSVDELVLSHKTGYTAEIENSYMSSETKSLIMSTLDANNDGEISDEEMMTYDDYLEKKKLHQEKINALAKERFKARSPIWVGLGTGVAGTIATLALATGTAGLVGGLVVAGAAAYGVYKLLSKAKYAQEAKAEFKQMKQDLDPECDEMRKLNDKYQKMTEAMESDKEMQQVKTKDVEEEHVMQVIVLQQMMHHQMEESKREEEERNSYYNNNREDDYNVLDQTGRPYQGGG